MNDQSATESLSVRPAVPPKVLSGIGSTVRSGTNLPAASASASLRPRRPFLSIGATDLAGEPPSARSASSRCVVVDDRDDGRRARLELLAEALLEAAVDLVLGELADDAAGGGADGDRGEQRRRGQADEDADAAAPAHALAAEVVAGLRDADLAALVVLDEDDALALDLLVLDELHQPVEILLGRLDGRVAGHDDARTRRSRVPLLDHRDGLAGMPAPVVGHLSYHTVMASNAVWVGYRQRSGGIVRRREGLIMGRGKSEQWRGGRQQTTAAILDAAEKLFAERGFTAVTVRDIASAAGVSHALVHRYLGPKEQVYRAMLSRRETVIRDAAPTEDDLLEATRLDAAGGRAPPEELRPSRSSLRPPRLVLRAYRRPVRGHRAARGAGPEGRGRARRRREIRRRPIHASSSLLSSPC